MYVPDEPSLPDSDTEPRDVLAAEPIHTSSAAAHTIDSAAGTPAAHVPVASARMLRFADVDREKLVVCEQADSALIEQYRHLAANLHHAQKATGVRTVMVTSAVPSEGKTGRSIAVALVGQPELARRLEETRLRQLKQRVALRCELTPLTLKDTAAYISARVKTAGGHAVHLFTRDAVIAIHQHSKGIPRVISVICDNALVSGFAADQRPVGASIVSEVCRSLVLPFEEPHAPQPVAHATTPRHPVAVASVEGPPGDGRRRFSFF
jgi:hypothetical protein